MDMPKKSLFEGKTKYQGKVAVYFEDELNVDPINAHYAAQYWVNNKKIEPKAIVDVINRLNAHGENVNPYTISAVIKKLNTQQKKAG